MEMAKRFSGASSRLNRSASTGAVSARLVEIPIAPRLVLLGERGDRVMPGHEERRALGLERHGAWSVHQARDTRHGIIEPLIAVVAGERQHHPEAQAPLAMRIRAPGTFERVRVVAAMPEPVELGTGMVEGDLHMRAVGGVRAEHHLGAGADRARGRDRRRVDDRRHPDAERLEDHFQIVVGRPSVPGARDGDAGRFEDVGHGCHCWRSNWVSVTSTWRSKRGMVCLRVAAWESGSLEAMASATSTMR